MVTCEKLQRSLSIPCTWQPAAYLKWILLVWPAVASFLSIFRQLMATSVSGKSPAMPACSQLALWSGGRIWLRTLLSRSNRAMYNVICMKILLNGFFVKNTTCQVVEPKYKSKKHEFFFVKLVNLNSIPLSLHCHEKKSCIVNTSHRVFRVRGSGIEP